MAAVDQRLIRSYDVAGKLVARVGVPLVDEYLEFLSGRCRPNTVLAAGYDLRVFLEVVGKPPEKLLPGDVLAFITAQRSGRPRADNVLASLDDEREPAGVSASTVRRRLSTVSGSSPFCTPAVTCRPTPCPAVCRPGGSGPGPGRACHWCAPAAGYRGS